MTDNPKTAARKRADVHRSEIAARKRAERDAHAVWRSCLGCGRLFPSRGVHNRLCDTCHRAACRIGLPDEYEPEVAEPYDRGEMGRMFEIGFEMGRAGDQWRTTLPGY